MATKVRTKRTTDKRLTVTRAFGGAGPGRCRIRGPCRAGPRPRGPCETDNEALPQRRRERRAWDRIEEETKKKKKKKNAEKTQLQGERQWKR